MQKNLRTTAFPCLLIFACSSVFTPDYCFCIEPTASNALVIIESGKASPAAAVKKYIAENGGRIEDSFSPDVFTGYLPPVLDGELNAKYGAVIFREEIPDLAVLEKYGDAAIAAAKVWNNNLKLLSAQPPPSEKKHLKVVLETDGVNFKLISKKIMKKVRPAVYRQPLAEGSYYIEAVDAFGKTLLVQSLADPAKIYYDFPAEPRQQSIGARFSSHKALKGGIFRPAKAEMILKLPYDPNIKTLRISRQKASVKGKILRTDKPAPLSMKSHLERTTLVDLSTVPEENE